MSTNQSSVAASPLKLGLGMYGSYLYLFCAFFFAKYFASKASGGKGGKGQPGGKAEKTVICGVEVSSKVRRCKLDPGLKAPGFKGSNYEEKLTFNLNLVSELAPLHQG